MGFLDPHAVTGGTGTASQQRRAVFAYTKGATGIDGPEDLKVVAVAGSPGVAGILPGGGSVAVESRRESYAITNLSMDGDALVDVPPAGSSGATHYVIVEVNDPEFHGQEAGATPRLVSSLSGRTRPYLPLARIDLEPGEGFDATSDVRDLRQVAVQREWRRLFSWHVPSGREFRLTNLETSEGQAFPNFIAGSDHGTGDYPWWVDIPTWATHVNMVGHWMGVRITPTAGRWGRIWVRIGHHSESGAYSGHIDSNRVDWNLPDDTSMWAEREFWQAGDQRPVPAALRGTRQPVILRGALHASGAGGSSSGPLLNPWSSVGADIQFTEGPA